MSYLLLVFIRRNTKPETGSRQSGSQRARTRGLAKERANRRSILRLQAVVRKIFQTPDPSLRQRHARHTYRPHPEERALARVSKDRRSRRRHCERSEAIHVDVQG